MISSLCAGMLLQYGKWRLIHLTNAVLIVASVLTMIDNITLQFIGRFFYGFAVGAFTVIVPKFINETSPHELKGPFGAISQLMVTFGIFLAALLGVAIPSQDPSTDEDASFYYLEYWRIVWGLPILLAILQSSLLFTLFRYDTPFYLKKRGEFEPLTELMRKIYVEDQIISRVDAIEVR